MKYFKLTSSTLKKEVGVYPQTIDAIWNLQIDEFEGGFNFVASKGPITGKFGIYDVILHKNAKATDLINGEDSPLILNLSERFYNFLINFIKKPYQYWDFKVFNNEIKSNPNGIGYKVNNIDKLKIYYYKMFHISYPEYDFIDYSKTVFYKFKKTDELIDYDKASFLSKNSIHFYKEIYECQKETPQIDNIKIIDEVKFKNGDDYLSTIKGLYKVNSDIKYRPKTIVFNSNIKKDIFRIIDPFNATAGYYVSEKLKYEIEKQGFTGMKFIPLKELSTAYDVEIIE